MSKWADYLISEVNYNPVHLISQAKRHSETKEGITQGELVDRETIFSDLKHGKTYLTIYRGLTSFKKGNKIRVFRMDGNHYIRIDKNKASLDYLGDVPSVKDIQPANNEISLSEKIQDTKPSAIRSENFPEHDTESEATPEQLARVAELEQQIARLESMQSSDS